jgi:hypothetical protein
MTFNPNHTNNQQIIGNYFGYTLIVVSVCPYFFETLISSKKRGNFYIAIFLILTIFIAWLFLLLQLYLFSYRYNLINKDIENRTSLHYENISYNLIMIGISIYLLVIFGLIIILIVELIRSKIYLSF